MDKLQIDPVLVAIIQRRLKSITHEMGLTLLRTTRSPILNEARDFVTGIYDAQGKMLEQTEYIPLLAFSLQPACQHIISYYGNDLYPGDVILHNDVFSMGNQLPDIAVYMPIFYGDSLAAWAACKGHQADVGGALPGGYNPRATEVWQEGVRIPPLKVYEKGQLRRDVWDMVFANIRYRIVEEDVRAQIGSCVVGERGIKGLTARYGLETFLSHVGYLLDVTEQMMRREIQNIPDGVYVGESYVHEDGIVEGKSYRIRVTITVNADDITFDYTGTEPQSPGFINAPYASTASVITLTLLMLVSPDIPHNEGMLRPIHMKIPQGTIFNPSFPAATTFGNHISDQHCEAIMIALSQALPQRVTALWNRMFGGTITGIDPRRKTPYVDILFLCQKGGSGGTYGADGYNYIGLIACAGGVVGQDYEMFELHDPHLLLYHEYWQDSAGSGRWRGGYGVESAFKFYGDNTVAVIMGDGLKEGAGGISGGKAGAHNRVEFTFPDGTSFTPRPKDIILSIPPETIYRQWAGGGGGYGDPYQRPVELVWGEVRDGLLSLKKAWEDYGLVIDPKTGTADYESSEGIRSKRKPVG